MPTASAKILLVEDNPADRQFIDACLHDGAADIELHFAARLDQAGTQLKHQRYELVIADLNLPDAEGLDTFFRVKEMASDAAIVVMTCMDDTRLANQAVLAGAQDYLIKGDMAPKRVLQSVLNALQRHSQFKQVSSEAQDLRKKSSSLREMAYIDSLTGLSNRRGLAKILSQMSTRGGRFSATHALLLDVDDFKKLNDLMGYKKGDLALKELARRLHALLKPTDIVARLAGDEFMALISASSAKEAILLAERIRASVYDGGAITVSVGVAALRRGHHTVEGLLELSQGALTSSKSSGKNRVCFSDELVAKPGAARFKAPVVHVPFYELRSGRLAGYRIMADGEPSHAESIESVLGAVNELMKAAIAEGHGLQFHLQLNHSQLLQLRPEDLASGLEAEPWRLRLNIPEVPMSPLPSGFLEAVHRLQHAGWAIGLANLDLGAHSWANLILLEPSVVSLAPCLVQGVSIDRERERGLSRICRALTGLGIYAVAGGVGTDDDWRTLDRLGIAYGWGPLWAGGVP
jgi:diguanylate cyclase (GGDEF)-like protein